MASLNQFETLILYANRHLGRFVPPGLKRRLSRLVFPRGRRVRFMYVDIVGTCNLRCPSCPVGNMGPVNPVGLMDKEQFAKVIRKAYEQHRVVAAALFNWGEPMLHPLLPEFARIVKRNGMECHLSSNLNIMRNVDELLAAGPDTLRVSLSGFTQATYGTTHVRGNIEQVKENMRLLGEAHRRIKGCRTRVTVYYHKYLDNLHEVEPMRNYALSLGFGWLENWAFYMPLEGVLKLVEGKATPDASAFAEAKFALPVVEAVREAQRLAAKEPCLVLDDEISIDHRGIVLLCCAVYDYEKNRLGSFLDMSEADLQRAKTRHPTCAVCMRHGVHRYFAYADVPRLREAFDRLVQRRLAQSGAASRSEERGR